MVTTPTPGPSDDLSTLAWVVAEVRRSLDAAHKALRRYLRDAEASSESDVAGVDPALLRQVRTHLHQSVGALELVGLGVAAQPLRAAEAAIHRLATRPAQITPAAVQTIESGSFAVVDYLSRRLAGKPVSPLSMFPQYRALQELAGATRAHPADLWQYEWRWRALDEPAAVAALPADASTSVDFETELLALMRGQAGAAARLGELCAGLAAGSTGHLRTLWQLAAAFLEALTDGVLRFDVHAKRAASRLLAQLRAGAAGQASDRLAQDLLFFCSQARPSAERPAGPRLAAARTAFGLTDHKPVDYDQASLGLFDPALVTQAQKRLATAKEVWSAVAAGERTRLAGLAEVFSLFADSLERLYPGGEALARALLATSAHCQSSPSEPSPALAMEVATALLYLDASLADGEFDHPELEPRVRRLAERIDLVRQGQEPGPLERWMEEVYRRVSDRQTIGNVVQELRSSLAEVEKQIDQYFRDPAQRELLIPVPAQLSAMRGVLSLLDMDQASQAVLRMRDDVDNLANTEVDPERAAQTGAFDRLADNLGALSFLIDMVSVQPQLARSLFRFDAASGQLQAVMAREGRRGGATVPGVLEGWQPTLVEQVQSVATSVAQPQALERELAQLTQQARAADEVRLAEVTARAQSALARASDAEDVAQVQRELADSISALVATQVTPAPEPTEPPRPIPPERPPAAPGQTGLEDDTEMREIFLEEAREVTASAREGLTELAGRPDDLAAMTVVRRAFHTLKGSSRMVGLRDFGEAAWACEQLYNARLAESAPADADLRGFSAEVLDRFDRWVDAIEAGDSAAFGPGPIVDAADALRLEGRRVPLVPTDLHEPAPAAAGLVTALLERVPDLPSAADLELSLPPTEFPTSPEFDLDLPELTGATPAAAPPAAKPQPEPERVEFDFGSFTLDDVPALAAVAPAESAPPEPAPAAAAIELAALEVTELGIEPLAANESALTEPFELELLLPDDRSIQPTSTEPIAVPEVAWDLAAEEPVPVTEVVAEPEHVIEPPEPAPALAGVGPEVGEPEAIAHEEEQFKVIGDLRVSIPLFNIYLNEADELSRRLSTELAEWTHEIHRPAGELAVVLAHSLAGSSATVGFAGLSHLARSLEHALMRSNLRGHGDVHHADVFGQASEEIRRLLHQFAAGFLREPDAELLDRLAEIEHLPIEAVGDTQFGAAVEFEPLPERPEVEPEPEPAMPVEAGGRPRIEPTPAPPARAEVEVDATVGPDVFAQLGRPEVRPFEAMPLAVERTAVLRGDGGIEDLDDGIDAVDAIDAELFQIFDEEASELLSQLHARLREWAEQPGAAAAGSACMRTLHTLKGGARLAGAMRLGEMAHRMESAIEHLLAGDATAPIDVHRVMSHADALEASFDALRRAQLEGVASIEPVTAGAAPDEVVAAAVPPPAAAPAWQAPAEPPPVPGPVAGAPVVAVRTPSPAVVIDWSRFAAAAEPGAEHRTQSAPAPVASTTAVRVRAPLIERMVNHAGEVSITRSRIDSDVSRMKGSLADLDENLGRLRSQLRDLELQAELQIGSRLEAARAAALEFDPLEMDRYTRFQEITRMMAESVNDVATVQRGLQRTLQSTEDELARQARLTRDLQDDLLRTRMVEFDSLAERLYRLVRQAAKETGKQVRLDITGGTIEVDRGVLDRITGAFEHLLRNCVVHGIEAPAGRVAAGKSPTGSITIAVTQEGNEVAIEIRDDGAGLDLARIRDKAVASGLLAADAVVGDADLAGLIFESGFTTVDQVTGLAGRGVGMDVVRNDINAMGGRIETASAAGRGMSVRLVLPLTTAVTQVVMLRCGDLAVAVPTTLVEIVRRVPAVDLFGLYERGIYVYGDAEMPFHWLAALLQGTPIGSASGRTVPVVVIRSAAQRIAIHVDEVIGNQEVVVKNLGPQMTRLPGLAGMTLLPSGTPALIYNPVALAALYGRAARAATLAALSSARQAEQLATQAQVTVQRAPLVLVVDDSLTVRRVTQRLLVREGYRVAVAKDGLEGLERLAEELPAVVLTDIEMPRMDGFDLVRNMRVDPRLAKLPVIMITSRIAQKHRDYAAELGVAHYLGKPYVEDDLLSLVAGYAGKQPAAA